jgi:hypothetical protein
MRRIAPEVERLMWLVAENQDERAIADFESRFPELRAELAKHIAMIDGLKTAGKSVPPREIPRFVPRYPTAPPRPNRTLYVAFAFVLGALAFGTYSATTLLSHPVQKPPVPNPVVISEPKQADVVIPYVPPKSVNPDPQPVQDPAASEAVAKQDRMETVVSFKGERAPLTAALTMVCQKAGIVCELAPGLPSDEVVMDYEGLSARAVLDDLAEKHGFTVFPQTENVILIIPAKKDAGPTSTEPDHAPSLAPDSPEDNYGKAKPTKAGSPKTR